MEVDGEAVALPAEPAQNGNGPGSGGGGILGFLAGEETAEEIAARYEAKYGDDKPKKKVTVSSSDLSLS